jgi:hypothetical protein
VVEDNMAVVDNDEEKSKDVDLVYPFIFGEKLK